MNYSNFARTNRFAIIGLTALGLLYLLSCDPHPPANSRPAQAARGKVLFEENCASCHVKRDHPMLDTIEVEPPDLSKIMARRDAKEFPVLDIARIIDGRKLVEAHGPRDMPVWGDVFAERDKLDENQIKGKLGELIAYLMSIQVGE